MRADSGLPSRGIHAAINPRAESEGSGAAQQGDERIDVVEVDVTVGVAVAVEPVAARVGDVPGQRVGTERGDEGVDVIKIDVAVAILDLGLRILDWSDGAT